MIEQKKRLRSYWARRRTSGSWSGQATCRSNARMLLGAAQPFFVAPKEYLPAHQADEARGCREEAVRVLAQRRDSLHRRAGGWLVQRGATTTDVDEVLEITRRDAQQVYSIGM